MHRRQALLTLFKALAPGAGFSGESALRYTAKAVSFGPRPPGSDAILRLRAYILSQLKTTSSEIIEDDFTARTRFGPVAMKNIIARFRGTSGRALAVTGHYDTKLMHGVPFVGANDGGSSTGLLLQLVRERVKKIVRGQPPARRLAAGHHRRERGGLTRNGPTVAANCRRPGVPSLQVANQPPQCPPDDADEPALMDAQRRDHRLTILDRRGD